MNNQTIRGCVYFFRYKGTAPVLIGYTRAESVDKIFNNFELGYPVGGEILGVIRTKNPKPLWSDICERASVVRIRGQWFDITESDVVAEIEKFGLYYDSLHPEYKLSVDKWLGEMGFYVVGKMRDGQVIQKRSMYFMYSEWVGEGDVISLASFSKHLKELGFIFAYGFDSVSVGMRENQRTK